MKTQIAMVAAVAAVAAVTTGCVTVQGDTMYAGTYISNQPDSQGVNVAGSNGNNVYREAQGGKGVVANNDQTVPGGTQGRGGQVVIAGQDINQAKTAEVDAVASMQQGNKAAGSAAGDNKTDGGGTNVAPVLNATGQGTASSGAANNSTTPKPPAPAPAQ